MGLSGPSSVPTARITRISSFFREHAALSHAVSILEASPQRDRGRPGFVSHPSQQRGFQPAGPPLRALALSGEAHPSAPPDHVLLFEKACSSPF